MNETHWCEDKDTLLEYLYGDLEADRRRVFEGHLRTCVPCAREAEGLQGVRTELAGWAPPDVELGFAIISKDAVAMNGGSQPATVLRPPRWSAAAMPVWARVAAAVLVMGAGLGLANVQVRYGADGLNVSTGWMPAAPSAASTVSAAVPVNAAAAPAAWRTDLTALEAQLRQELQALRATPEAVPTTVARTTPSEEQVVLRRVQSLIAESERRQEQEFAKRLSQLGRDFEYQRRTDLVRLEQGFDRSLGRNSAEVAQQRRVLDLLVRASTSRVP